jgi:hypothetical protein
LPPSLRSSSPPSPTSKPSLLDPLRQHRAQDEGRIARGAAAGIVGDIGEHQRLLLVVPCRARHRLVEADIGWLGLPAQGEEVEPEPMRERLGLGLVAIGDDQDLAAHIRDIGPGKAVHDRDREHAVLALERGTAVDEAAHRLARGMEDADSATVEGGHHRPGAPLDRIGHEAKEIGGALGHVDMRIFFEKDDRRGALQLARAEIGVEIELDAERHLRPDQAADAGEKIALGIVITFGHHRAMQREQDGIDRQRRLEVAEDLVAQALIDRLHRLAGGLGEGAEAFHHLPAFRLGVPAPDLERRAEQRHPLAIAAPAEEAGVLEELQPRRQR